MRDSTIIQNQDEEGKIAGCVSRGHWACGLLPLKLLMHTLMQY